jgi:hypothetical protein
MFSVDHHDLPSLFGGKIHALLFRPYVKGRDFYDLMFFLARKTPFNFELLCNASCQTNPETVFESVNEVVGMLGLLLGNLEDNVLAADLELFLLEPEEIPYITVKNLTEMLERNAKDGVFEQH